MSGQDLIKEHLEDKCKYCDLPCYDGIRITRDRKTRCDRDEKKR